MLGHNKLVEEREVFVNKFVAVYSFIMYDTLTIPLRNFALYTSPLLIMHVVSTMQKL